MNRTRDRHPRGTETGKKNSKAETVKENGESGRESEIERNVRDGEGEKR